jgi:Tfp pilus assembly protein PilX
VRLNPQTIIRRLRREESGIAIVVVMGVILVAGMLAAAAISASTNLVRSSVKDTRNTRALAAANAGIEIAVYRMQKMQPSAEKCLTTDGIVSWNSATGANPRCPATASGSLGNDATYKFWISPAFDTAASPFDVAATKAQLTTLQNACGQTGTPASGERCVTAMGTVGGVSRRVQLRIKGKTLFPIVGGLIGLHAVSWAANNSWGGGNLPPDSDIGSNDLIYFGNNNTSTTPANSHKCIGPPPPIDGCSNVAPRQTLTLTATSVDELDWIGSKLAAASAPQTALPGYTNTAANPRRLIVPANTILTLPAGTYNFCKVQLLDGAKIIVTATPGSYAEVYVDSARRDDVWNIAGASGCAVSGSPPNSVGQAGDGTVDAGPANVTAGAAGSTLLDGLSTGRLDFFVYGTKAPTPQGVAPPPGGGINVKNGESYQYSTCGDDFNWRNMFAAPLDANNVYIYAPNSNVKLATNSKIYGGINACTTSFWASASGAGFSAPSSSVQPPPGPPLALTGSFRECTTTNPGAFDLSYASCGG